MEKVRSVAALQAKTDFSSPHNLTDEDAVDVAVRGGLLPSRAELPLSSYRRLKRMHGLNAHERPAVRFRAKRPNELHQFDFSASDYFVLDRPITSGGETIDWVVRVQRVAKRPYKNKPAADRMRLWIASVVDDYSSAVSFEYLVMRGEDTEHAVDVLKRLWSGREKGAKTTHPFGVPEKIYTDNASWASGNIFKALMYTASVEHIQPAVNPKTQTSAPRAKGKVERFFLELWRRFELRFVIEEHDARTAQLPSGRTIELKRREILLSELQAEAAHFMELWNQRLHPQFAEVTRIASWLRINHMGGVVTLDDLESYALRSVERAVNVHLEVRVENRFYRILGADGTLIRKKVRVLLGRAGRVVVELRTEAGLRRFATKPAETLPAGEFRAFKRTGYDDASDAGGRLEIRNARPTLVGEEPKTGTLLVMPPPEKERVVDDPAAVRTEIKDDAEGFRLIAEELREPIPKDLFELCKSFIGKKRGIEDVRNFGRSVRDILAQTREEEEKRKEKIEDA